MIDHSLSNKYDMLPKGEPWTLEEKLQANLNLETEQKKERDKGLKRLRE
jgi:hypothetical protein